MAPRAKRTLPRRPDLPGELTESPGRLESLDSWERVRAVEGVAVAAETADVELIEAHCTGLDLSSRRLTGLRARDVVFERCDLSGAVLDGARLDRVAFTGCRLTGMMLTAARVSDVIIEDCVANLGNFRATKGERLFIERTVLVEADFYTAALTDSAILDCDLSRANVSELRAPGLALHGSRLDGIKGVTALSGALIDDEQLLPLGVALVAGLGIAVGDRPQRPATAEPGH